MGPERSLVRPAGPGIEIIVLARLGNVIRRSRAAFAWLAIAGSAMPTGSPVLPPYRAQKSLWSHVTTRLAMFAMVIAAALFYGFVSTAFPMSFWVALALPIVVSTLVIIWLLPETGRPPTGLLIKLFFVFTVVLLLWPNYLALDLGPLPWISFRRLVVAPLAITFLIALSVSKSFRDELVDVLQVHPILWKLLVAFTAVQGMSIAMSATPMASLQIFINNLVVWTMMFFLSAWVFRDPRYVKMWMKTLVLLAFLFVVIAILERRVEHILWAKNIPAFLQVSDEVVANVLTPKFKSGVYRVVGPFSVPLAFSECLALITPFVLHFAMTAKSISSRIALIVLDILILIAIELTLSRLGMVGWITAHVVYLMLWGVRRWQSNRQGLLGPMLTLSYPVLLAALALVVVAVPAVHNRVLGGSDTQFSNQGREQQFVMAREKWLRSPLIGYGPGRSSESLGYANRGGVSSVDSYVLTISLDYGFVGLGLLTALAFAAFWINAKAAVLGNNVGYSDATLPTAAGIASWIMIKLVLSQEDSNTLFYLLLGSTAALAYQRDKNLTDVSRVVGRPQDFAKSRN